MQWLLLPFLAACLTVSMVIAEGSEGDASAGSLVFLLKQLLSITVQRDLHVTILSIRERRALRVPRSHHGRVYFSPEVLSLLPSDSMKTNYASYLQDVDIDMFSSLSNPPGPRQSESSRKLTVNQREFQLNEQLLVTFFAQDSLYNKGDFSDLSSIKMFLKNKCQAEIRPSCIYLIGQANSLLEGGKQPHTQPIAESFSNILFHEDLTGSNHIAFAFIRQSILDSAKDEAVSEIARQLERSPDNRNPLVKIEALRDRVFTTYAEFVISFEDDIAKLFPELLVASTKLSEILPLDAYFEFERIWIFFTRDVESSIMLVNIGQFARATRELKQSFERGSKNIKSFFQTHIRGVEHNINDDDTVKGERTQLIKQEETANFVVRWFKTYTFSLILLLSIGVFVYVYIQRSGLLQLYEKKFV